MDILWLLYTLALAIFSIFFLHNTFFPKQRNRKLPPSPVPALPIFGHLHLLKFPIHRTIQKLSSKYGPIIYLYLGQRPVILVSSPSIAEECFTKNDIIFGDRPECIMSEHSSFSRTEVTFLPYGGQWRNIRRIMTINIFSNNALKHFAPIREEEVRFLVRKLIQNSPDNNGSHKVNLHCLFEDLIINMRMKEIVGRQWSDSEPFNKEVFGADIPIHLCDFVPFFRWIGLGGFEKHVKYFCGEFINYMKYVMGEGRMKEEKVADDGSISSNKEKRTIIQSLLSVQKIEPEYYTDNLILAILSNIFTAGGETTSSTIEWAMAILLNHPEVIEKLRNEIDLQITLERLVEDSDLPKLPYLHCVIKETLRLFPGAPLLLPRVSNQDCTLGGYHIPRGTTLVVNCWAIHRDPSSWEEPTKFKPERFLEKTGEESEGAKYLPFGIGRRPCPGAAMATRAVELTIATLIQCFEWERIGPELEDLEEGNGLFVFPKAKPLEAFCKPRPSMKHLLTQF